jgi:hypothetical protein
LELVIRNSLFDIGNFFRAFISLSNIG